MDPADGPSSPGPTKDESQGDDDAGASAAAAIESESSANAEMEASSAYPSLVVGVGASAGGLEAFKLLLAALPTQSGMAFILVQHLHPTHRSLLAELLSACTTMRVTEATHGLRLERDTVYVIPPGCALAVLAGCLVLERPRLQRGVRLPVDRLFESLAHENGLRAVGVVLSGAGSDGSSGLQTLHEAGGLTLVQDPKTCVQTGMPMSAVRTGAADHVVEIAQMPQLMLRHVANIDGGRDRAALPPPPVRPSGESASHPPPRPVGRASVELSDSFSAQLSLLLESQADFALRAYKRGTVERRVLRRMTQVGLEEPEAYLQYLSEHRNELKALIADLLIGVTAFMRDPEAFTELAQRVIAPMIEQAQPGAVLRAWVPGCATGEEAYSLVMLFFECMTSADKELRLQLFATDIDGDALATARAGVYSAAAVERVPQHLVAKYFNKLDSQSLQISRPLRDTVSFAVHDLTQDPPLSRMQLVSCRNVLIYLRPAAQEHVIGLLHFALADQGALFLGSAETASLRPGMFDLVTKKLPIYRKNSNVQSYVGDGGAAGFSSAGRQTPVEPVQAEGGERLARRSSSGAGAGDRMRRFVLRKRVPPTLIVDAHGQVVFMHGELRPFLRFPDGEPRLTLASLLAVELGSRVRAALERCRETEQEVTVQVASPRRDSAQVARANITVTPAFELGAGMVMLSFAEVSPIGGPDSSETAVRAMRDPVRGQLERELAATRADLRHVVTDLESSNEDLRSHNEEATALNEELQSANEELEATSEELRSLNEELTTVNTQLREKVEQLEQTNDDLSNFFASTKIATLFLDEQLRIKRFTPAAQELLRLSDADQGRLPADIARELLQHDLPDQAAQVLEHFVAQSREIHTTAGQWVTRQILPYRTESRRVEGVVVTFVDITEHKEMLAELSRRERQQAVVARLGLRALEDHDLQTFLNQVVCEVQETLQSDFCKLMELQPGGDLLLLRAGVGWHDRVVSGATVAASEDSQAGFTVKSKQPVIVTDLGEEKRFAGPSLLLEHEVKSGLSCVIGHGLRPYGVIGVHTRELREFTPDDANFLQAVAAVVAGAIEQHEARARAVLERAAAAAAAEASGLRAAVAQIHALAAAELGSAVAELWNWREGGLVRTGVYASAAFRGYDLSRQFARDTFARDEGVVGRVFARQRAEWVTCSQPSSRFTRVEQARSLKLRTGFAVPIIRAGQPLGVWTVFFREHVHGNEAFLLSLEAIGRSLGDLAQRVRMEQRLYSTVDRAPVGIADRTMAGAFMRVNDRLCAITGYSREELLSMALQDIVHADDVPAEQALFVALRDGTQSRRQQEQRYLRKDGSALWVSTSTSVVCSDDGHVEYCITIIEDISARKEAEDSLRISEARFRQVLLSSPVPLLLYNEFGEVLAMSKSWTEATGYTMTDIPTIGDWIRRAFPQNVDRMQAFADAAWQGETSFDRRTEYEIFTASGELRSVQFHATMLGSSGGVRLRLTAAMDVTQQRRFERELLEANRQKDEFLAMLGHELRNPLAAVRSATELLGEVSDEPGLQQRLQAILERQTSHMAKLLDGLLDVSRVVQGKIELDRGSVDLTGILRDVVDDIAGSTASDGLDIVALLPDDPVWVEGDSVRLTQIVDNVLSNAVKYTPAPGEIRVTLSAVDGLAHILVRDTGIGIEADLLPHLFEPFRQGQQSLDRARGGLGIGLSLVKRLVELHGGQVVAHSPGAGHGAEFLIKLPLCPAREKDLRSPEEATGHRRILIIEDNEDAAELLRSSLARQGHEVSVALRGLQGVELARELRPDVVICDLGLPDGLSGFDVAEQLRGDPATSSICLLAVSGYGRSADKQRSREAGFDGHLTKPVSIQDMERSLRSLARLH